MAARDSVGLISFSFVGCLRVAYLYWLEFYSLRGHRGKPVYFLTAGGGDDPDLSFRFSLMCGEGSGAVLYLFARLSRMRLQYGCPDSGAPGC